MPSIETIIWLAIKSHLATLTTSPTMTIYDPGATITPASDSNGPLPFITTSDVRNDSNRVTIGPEVHERSGTLLVSVQWPIARAVSHIQLVEIAGKIAEHFKADTRMKYGLTCVRTTKDADILQPYRDNTYRVAVVRVYWSTT